jgi:large subunit ribosomal protein L29
MKDSYKNLTFPEIKAKLEEVKKQYFDLRFQLVIGHIDNPLQKRNLRRKIARLNTLVHQHDLQGEANK